MSNAPRRDQLSTYIWQFVGDEFVRIPRSIFEPKNIDDRLQIYREPSTEEILKSAIERHKIIDFMNRKSAENTRERNNREYEAWVKREQSLLPEGWKIQFEK